MALLIALYIDVVPYITKLKGPFIRSIFYKSSGSNRQNMILYDRVVITVVEHIML